MSVFNGEPYLGEAVESVLNQTWRDYEFLIVNDCSTDGTDEILRGYARRDSRIQLLHNASNLGLTRSLNRALELAKGELIARQDADDLSEPTRLEEQVNFLRAHPDYGLIGSRTSFIDEQNTLIRRNELKCEHEELNRYLLAGAPFVHGAMMFRRALQLRYDETLRYAQDYDLAVQAVSKSKIANLPASLYRFRLHEKSISAQRGEEQAAYMKIIAERHLHNLTTDRDQTLFWCYLEDEVHPTLEPRVKELLHRAIPMRRGRQTQKRQFRRVLREAKASGRQALAKFPLCVRLTGLMPALLWVFRMGMRATFQRRST